MMFSFKSLDKDIIAIIKNDINETNDDVKEIKNEETTPIFNNGNESDITENEFKPYDDGICDFTCCSIQ